MAKVFLHYVPFFCLSYPHVKLALYSDTPPPPPTLTVSTKSLQSMARVQLLGVSTGHVSPEVIQRTQAVRGTSKSGWLITLQAETLTERCGSLVIKIL